MKIRNLIFVLWLPCALLFALGLDAQLAAADQPVPPPWQSTDVGAVGTPGNAYQGPDGDLYMAGAGADIWGTADSFHFVYQPIRDGQITALLGEEENTHAFAKTGVMIRQTLDPGSPHVILDVKPDGGVEFMTRSAQDGETSFIAGASVKVYQYCCGVAMSAYLKLVRSGGVVTGSVCSPRDSCQTLGSVPWPSGPALIGVAVTSHDPSRLNHAYFPAALPAVSVIPRPWYRSDVGAVGQRGDAFFENGTFTVRGAGADIWGDADSFTAVTQWLSGDGAVVARVVNEQNTHPFAKAGVTMGGLAPSSARVIFDVKPDGSLEFMARFANGQPMSFIAGAAASFPVWLRLARSGDQIDASMSADGSSTWTAVGSVRVALGALYAGLAVTSHDPNVLNTATFDNVSLVANLLRNPGFEESTVPALGPGWVSDSFRQTPAQSETAAPRSGDKNGACRTTASLDCGMYQDIVAPVNGNYTFTVYANADRPGGLVGANINGTTVASLNVNVGVRPQLPEVLYTMGFSAKANDTIRVWIYSPATPGSVVIDDASLMLYLRNPGFEESTVPALADVRSDELGLGPGWVSDGFRETPAQSETAAPHSGDKDGACRTTASLDCGIYQDIAAPVNGNYIFTVYASADHPGGLVGVNLNLTFDGLKQVEAGGVGNYQAYTMGFWAKAGDTIRVWMYSPATPGSVVIDDASLTLYTGPR